MVWVGLKHLEAPVGKKKHTLTVLIAVYRVRQAKPEKARWVPFVLAAIDYGATSTLGMLDIWWTGTYHPGQHAIASSILLSFSLARVSITHVVYSLVLAEATYTELALYGGSFSSHETLFVMVGFTVLVAPPSAIVMPLRCALAKLAVKVVAVVEATCTVS